MNVIAAPKTGKSWLAADLALSCAAGTDWLGLYRAKQGNVLFIDNELHPETLSHRIRLVAECWMLTRKVCTLIAHRLSARATEVHP